MKNMKIPSNIEELRENFNLLQKYKHKNNRRTQEEIISDIIIIIKDADKEIFIPWIMQMMNMIELRHSTETYKNLMSPLKQFAYVIDLYFSIEHKDNKGMPNEAEWNKLTELLMEVEMTYFGDIGFFSDDSENFEYDKISVSLKSFFDFYSNAQLSYDEQTLDRLKTNFEKFNDAIKIEFGFTSNDIIIFCHYIGNLIRNKSKESFKYAETEEWQKLTSKFIDKGLTDPYDWASQPELKAFIDFITKPGSLYVHSLTILQNVDLDQKTVNNIMSFLKFNDSKIKERILYYADERQYFLTPIVELNSEEVLFPPFKFLIEAFYNRINIWLSETKKEKYTKLKNKALEKKTFDIFHTFFKDKALFFQEFYFDKNNRAEQDLLILYKDIALIVEIKDFKFRAPMRNPIKAFDKIKSDFKGGIQKAYDQCKRFEDKLILNEKFKIFSENTNLELYEINPKRINHWYSIIITQHKYGGIQTDLSELLKRDINDPYPWSICVDDLEIFLLGLIKIKKNSAHPNLINFLEYREYFHERLICSDELELCGLFINDQYNFRRYAEMEDHFATDIRMSNIFDAYYQNGLGFANEINIDIKRKNPIGKYNKSFTVQSVRGRDLKI